MRSDEAGVSGAASTSDGGRRRALALVAWSAGLVVTGSVTARAKGEARGAAEAESLSGTAVPRAMPAAPPLPPGDAPVKDNAVGPAAGASTPSGASVTLTGDALVLHVARRVSFGPTPSLLDEIRSEGVDAWLERQLAPADIPDEEVDGQIVRLHDLERSPAEFKAIGRFGDSVLADLRVAALVRAARSNRHLQEVMVDLWHDHLAASGNKGVVGWHLPAYDRASIRPHALGSFVDLLGAATKSGAMLEYMDTARSSAPDVNENHGRELLELHTVGIGAGFGQDDVTGAARVLSGWTVDPHTLAVVFDPSRHHDAPAAVLGWSTPGRTGAQGASDLDSLLRYLATHPATANRIASLLVRRFVADVPPEDVVASTAAAYLAAGSDLGDTLRHVFNTSAFRSGGAPIVRRPFDLFAAQVRTTEAILDVPDVGARLLAVPSDLGPLVNPVLAPVVDASGMLDPVVEPVVRGILEPRPIARSVTDVLWRNGQLLFMAPNPSGHAVAGFRWVSGDALLRRWTLGATLAQGGLPGIAVDSQALVGDARTVAAAADALATRCFGTVASATTRGGAIAATGRADDDVIDVQRDVPLLLAFLLAAPEMQVR